MTFLHEFPWKKYAAGKTDFEICGLPEDFILLDPNSLSDESLFVLVEFLMKDKIKVQKKLSFTQASEDNNGVESAEHQENVSPSLITPTRVSPNKWRFLINSS